MGFFDSVTDFGGGRFAGEMTSEGSGARIRAGVRDIPIIGDVDLVNVHVPGFRDGGVVGEQQRRADESKAQLAALHQRHGPTEEQVRARRRQGGKDAPSTRPTPSASSSSSSAPDVGHTLAPRSASAPRGPFGRRKHEIMPGVPCPSCATGETTPVR